MPLIASLVKVSEIDAYALYETDYSPGTGTTRCHY